MRHCFCCRGQTDLFIERFFVVVAIKTEQFKAKLCSTLSGVSFRELLTNSVKV